MNEVTPFCLNTGLTDFFPLPRRILELPLSSTAKLAYGVLLDRGTLSRKNRYANEAGEIYVIYTIERLARTLGKGTTAVKRCLKELEKAEPDPPGALWDERPQPYFFIHSDMLFWDCHTVWKQPLVRSENRPCDRSKTVS